MVLLAEYRGTQVAVKRVIPPQNAGKRTGRTSTTFGGQGTKTTVASIFDAASDTFKKVTHAVVEGDSNSQSDDLNTNSTASGIVSGTQSWSPMSMSLASGARHGVGGLSTRVDNRKSRKVKKAPTLKQLKEEFMKEMRYLSKLRHPCVTTVMGAMITGNEPMVSIAVYLPLRCLSTHTANRPHIPIFQLVMEYMEHGSLYDLLHNETMAIDGELILPVLRDVSQGVRFLHSADPQCLHGDLKTANILVDHRFRCVFYLWYMWRPSFLLLLTEAAASLQCKSGRLRSIAEKKSGRHRNTFLDGPGTVANGECQHRDDGCLFFWGNSIRDVQSKRALRRRTSQGSIALSGGQDGP